MVNTGQTLLVLGALVLFSILSLSINRIFLGSDHSLIETDIEMAGITIANRIMAEAGTKYFDVKCAAGNPINSPNDFTSPYGLGRAAGEYYPDINDLDDYHNLTIVDSLTMPSVTFYINCDVHYVNPLNPSNKVYYQTYAKKLRVTISSSMMINPASKQPVQIVMEKVFAYYLC